MNHLNLPSNTEAISSHNVIDDKKDKLLADSFLVSTSTQLKAEGADKWEVEPIPSVSFAMCYTTQVGRFVTPNNRCLAISNRVALDDTFVRSIVLQCGLTGKIMLSSLKLGTSVRINTLVSTTLIANRLSSLHLEDLISGAFNSYFWFDKPLQQHEISPSMLMAGSAYDLLSIKHTLLEAEKKEAEKAKVLIEQQKKADWFELEQSINRLRYQGQNKTAWLF